MQKRLINLKKKDDSEELLRGESEANKIQSKKKGSKPVVLKSREMQVKKKGRAKVDLGHTTQDDFETKASPRKKGKGITSPVPEFTAGFTKGKPMGKKKTKAPAPLKKEERYAKAQTVDDFVPIEERKKKKSKKVHEKISVDSGDMLLQAGEKKKLNKDIRHASITYMEQGKVFDEDIEMALEISDEDEAGGKVRAAIKAVEDNKIVARIQALLEHESKAPYGRTKLMVIGEGRAGKTCTIKALLNLGFDPSEESTKGFDVTRVDASNWEKDEKSYLVEHLEHALQEEMDVDAPSTRDTAKAGKPAAKSSTKDALEKPHATVTDAEVKRYGENINMSLDSGKKLGFSIWDFGGQKVFYTLHHLFLTEFGCYLLVFNVEKLLSKDTVEESIGYLRFWLFSKKIHAPSAPVMVVGTHADVMSEADSREIHEILINRVFGTNDFKEIWNGGSIFFPIDNKSGNGISELRTRIEEVVKKQPYIEDEVPVSFLRLLELLLDLKQDYVPVHSVEDVMTQCGLSMETLKLALEFLNSRGLITYFGEVQTLERFIILQPQWLINGITDVIFDKDEHAIPKFDSEYGRDFRKFTSSRILSSKLLKNIWDLKGYSDDVQAFFKQVMIHSSLMCEYLFDKSESFIVPTLVTSHQDEKAEMAEYSGPFCIVDFSGNYDEKIVEDEGERYVRYLPFGVYERLICLCISHAAKMQDSAVPQLSYKSVKMSFGVDIDFELSLANNEDNQKVWIRIATEDDASLDVAKKLVKLIYSMIKGLREDFFSKSGGKSCLAMSLLLPSSTASGQVLAEYSLLQSRRESARSKDQKIRPSKLSSKKIKLSAFAHWFEDISEESQGSLVDPDKGFRRMYSEDNTLQQLSNLKHKKLPGDLKYHCFLSYKQSSAIDLVGKQYYILTERGYKCWYDQQFRGDITLENMREGVKNSMCYILLLSKDIFPSFYVEEEVKTAVSLGKPIILLHHPSTGSSGYWQFSDYIEKAPAVLKNIFKEVESIQLQRRHYLEEAVTQVIDDRLQSILNSLS